ncbi:hypothetical protein O0L34_g9735 [Tuta absoluta]|nr:hypothetical protein O0L34_g9735 [Tuta absoluta]
MARVWANSAQGIYSVWVWPIPNVNIYNPEDIEKVIATTKFNDKSPIYNILAPWLGEGLLLSKGVKWHQRRKILTPAFHFDVLKEFFVTIEDNSNRLIQTLHKTKGESTNLIPVISNYTLNSICETAMGTRLADIEDEGKSYKDAIYALGYIMVQRFMRIYLLSDFIFNYLSSWGKEQRKHLKTLHEYTSRVIKDRKQYVKENGYNLFAKKNATDDTYMTGKKKKCAMLDLMLLSEEEGEIDRQGIQEEVDTFMFEGHDTTASGLTYCLMLLANNKDVQNKIVAELNKIFGDTDRPATIEDFAKMKYLECCIKESLRLYPPVPFVSRLIDEDVELSNYTVPASTYCHIHIYDLHRREEYFKNAEKFDPDRFLPENSYGRHPYSYIPFSAGPRNCIGQKFAMMELKSCVAAVLRNFMLKPVTEESDLVFTSDLVLRNDGPVCVKFVPRSIDSRRLIN